MTKLFLQKGASVYYQYDDSFTPIHVAVEKDPIEVSKFLVQKGACEVKLLFLDKAASTYFFRHLQLIR